MTDDYVNVTVVLKIRPSDYPTGFEQEPLDSFSVDEPQDIATLRWAKELVFAFLMGDGQEFPFGEGAGFSITDAAIA